MAARVGDEANGTATSCVQLARLSPVIIYKMIKSPALVALKIVTRQMIADATQAIKYAPLIERCHELAVSLWLNTGESLASEVDDLHDSRRLSATHGFQVGRQRIGSFRSHTSR